MLSWQDFINLNNGWQRDWYAGNTFTEKHFYIAPNFHEDATL